MIIADHLPATSGSAHQLPSARDNRVDLVPLPRSFRYDSLDLWRGVACLLVLANHSVFYERSAAAASGFGLVNGWAAAIAQRLWAGVPIFFVISGYCITATIDKQRRTGVPIRTYFYRRFRRIFPPFWVTLVTTALVVACLDLAVPGLMTRDGLFLRPWWYSPWQWAGTATLTEFWRWHLIGGQKALILGHAWTLCYEEQFYAVAGLLLAICPRRYFAGTVAVTAAVLASMSWAAWTGVPIDGFFFDGNWIQFSFGVLVYYTLNYGQAGWRWIASAGFAAAFVGTAFGDLSAPAKNDAQVYAVASAFAFAALWIRPYDRALNASVWLKPLRNCGLMCYSLYLVHLPVVDLIKALLLGAGVATKTMSPFVSLIICGVPSLWVAWKFHLIVERRFMGTPTSLHPALNLDTEAHQVAARPGALRVAP